MSRKSSVVLSATLIGLILSGCASGPTDMPSASNTPSGYASMTPDEAMAAYSKIAQASCDKALVEGVVEYVPGEEGFTSVMVPKSEAYRDYSAAYFDNAAKKHDLIWETDAFSVCADANALSMAAEAGQKPDFTVEFNATSGAFITTRDLGEYGIANLQYTVANGVMVTMVQLNGEGGDPHLIRYGNITDADRAILETAVEEFLAKQ